MFTVTRRDLVIFALALAIVYLTHPSFLGINSTYQQNQDLSTETENSPISISSDTEKYDFHFKSIINLPEWYRNNDWGLTVDPNAKFNATVALAAQVIDNEVEVAWLNFFYQATKGLILEMGAMDGKLRSVSLMFEQALGWRSILIDANPVLASQLSKNRPDALNFNFAICDSPKTVHYISHPTRREVNGILEFMSPGYFKVVYPELLLANGNPDWKKISGDPRVKKVPCVPLMSVLEPLGITHINFFVLDVENAELSVLKAIDFDKIRFDVISIETDRGVDDVNATKQYVDSIIALLTSKGYVLWNRKVGENTWVTHPDFLPLKKI